MNKKIVVLFLLVLTVGCVEPPIIIDNCCKEGAEPTKVYYSNNDVLGRKATHKKQITYVGVVTDVETNDARKWDVIYFEDGFVLPIYTIKSNIFHRNKKHKILTDPDGGRHGSPSILSVLLCETDECDTPKKEECSNV